MYSTRDVVIFNVITVRLGRTWTQEAIRCATGSLVPLKVTLEPMLWDAH